MASPQRVMTSTSGHRELFLPVLKMTLVASLLLVLGGAFVYALSRPSQSGEPQRVLAIPRPESHAVSPHAGGTTPVGPIVSSILAFQQGDIAEARRCSTERFAENLATGVSCARGIVAEQFRLCAREPNRVLIEAPHVEDGTERLAQLRLVFDGDTWKVDHLRLVQRRERR